MPVTLKDVAELAGVSRSAVSRTYTQGASVSEKTREKVLKAAASLGYSPNVLASSLTTGRTKMIGLISNNFHNPVFLEVFDLFTRGLQERGLRPLLVNLTDETDPAASVRMLQQYSVDGVIVASSTLPQTFAVAFRDAGLPVVHSFGRHSARPKVDVLGIDNVAAGKIAAKTLVARGYKTVSYLGGPETATSALDRKKGFLDELKGYPEVRVTSCFASNYSFEAGYSKMKEIVSDEAAEAYFCADDVLSFGALAALKDAGYSVPEDVGVIGLNDMKMSSWASNDLTTIHNPFSAIIDASIDRVIALIDDPDSKPQSRMFECSVIERGTLKPEA